MLFSLQQDITREACRLLQVVKVVQVVFHTQQGQLSKPKHSIFQLFLPLRSTFQHTLDEGGRKTFFKRQIFEPNLIRLPEMNNIRELIERSRRGIKFVGKSRKKIAELISQSANETGASRVIKLIALLELMATSEEYEILASTGFMEP